MNLNKGWYLLQHNEPVMVDPLCIQNFDWNIPFDKLIPYLSGQSIFLSEDRTGSVHLRFNKPLYGGGNQQSTFEQTKKAKIFNTITNVGGTALLFVPGAQIIGIGVLVVNKSVNTAYCIANEEYGLAARHLCLGALAACPLVGKTGELAQLMGNTVLSGGSALSSASKGDVSGTIVNLAETVAGSACHLDLRTAGNVAKVAGNAVAIVNSGTNIYEKSKQIFKQGSLSAEDFCDVINEGCTVVVSAKNINDVVAFEKMKQKLEQERLGRIKTNTKKLQELRKQMALLDQLESSQTEDPKKVSTRKIADRRRALEVEKGKIESEIKIEVYKSPGKVIKPKNHDGETVIEYVVDKNRAFMVKTNLRKQAIANFELASKLKIGVDIIIDNNSIITKKGFRLDQAIKQNKISKTEAVRQIRAIQSILRRHELAHTDVKVANMIYCVDKERIVTIDNGDIQQYGSTRRVSTESLNTTKPGYYQKTGEVGPGTDAKGFDLVVKFVEDLKV